jgi:hypothetical protein
VGRATVVWLVLVALLGALAGGVDVPVNSAVAAAVFIAVVVGASARDAFVNAGVRGGAIAIVAGPVAVSVVSAVPGVVAGVLAGMVVGSVGVVAAAIVVPAWVAAVCGGSVGVAVARLWPRPSALSRVSLSPPLWLVGGAVVAAVFAGGLGAVVAVSRFGAMEQVLPGAFSRALAATVLCDGLLGAGGFARAATAARAGRLSSWTPRFTPPGPVVVAMALGAVIIIVGPRVFPPVAVDVAVAIKVVVGAVVGGALHLSGGLRGIGAAADVTRPPTTA